MQWSSEGIVIGSRKQGDSNLLLEVLTPDRGRCYGLVRGGRSRRQQPALQLGNQLTLTWRARLEEHLGNFSIEPMNLRAANLMQSAFGIHGLQTLCALLHLLPERDPHPALYHALDVILDHMEAPEIASVLMVRFELQLLNELGFGLDLKKCAATGTQEELIWVSPRSGRAVCRQAGQPYAAKLLPLPPFMKNTQLTATANAQDLKNAFELTGFFLFKYIFEPRNIIWPSARDSFLFELTRIAAATEEKAD
ncbi:DNA repair protein RecO [Rhodobacteraceae bacterium RKSG542]|uniref:DNA repair protein RecO n=1 Tax=Pseudovibrio flavus TaxID=2529854 RepID=UPI0012BB737B|nr:DNA repair protein RecO [Pseudovibrio flavus]MTI17402.1 DNA repair protein RecO [Pseudovibrio flavus]